MDKLLEQLKQSPSQIKLIPKILQELLKSKYNPQQKYKVISDLIKIIGKIIKKIDQKKQAHTYKFITNMSVKLVQIILHSLGTIGSQQTKDFKFDSMENQLSSEINWFESIGQLFRIYGKDQLCTHQLTKTIVDIVLSQVQVNFCQLKNGEILLAIFKQIKQRKVVQRYLASILRFIMSIQHFNSLDFVQEQKTSKSYVHQGQNILKNQFKEIFQQIFIDCLDLLEKLSIEQQLSIYRKLGQKSFSKLANPLILSQFLLKKLRNQQQNPVIQIQILSSLFILVGKYGLQLQKYYQNLQKIIGKKRSYGESLFQLKNSKRFLKLIQASMRSSKVPFKTILSLSHLIINSVMRQKSQFTFWALSFFVNLVKKHRQLQNHLSQFSQIQTLKYHYSPVVRSLVSELSKNLNKSQYLDIEEFAKVNCKKLCNKKLEQISKKINNNQDRLEFKITNKFDKL